MLLLQSFCYSKDAEHLKKLALRVVEKNRNASLKDVAVEAYLNVSSSMKILENPSKVPPTCSALVTKSKPEQQVPRNSVQNDQVRSKSDSKCFSCGGGHLWALCKLREAVCHKCAKKGHIASVCRSGPKDPKNVGRKDNIVTQAISAVGKRRRRYITISIDKKDIRLQYDTDSNITVIGRVEWIRLGSPRLVEGDIVEHAGGSNLELIGKLRASIHAVDRDGVIDICVAGRNALNLLGLDTIDSLRLWPALLNETTEVKCVLSLQQNKPSITSVPSTEVAALHGFSSNVEKDFPDLFAGGLELCRDFKARFSLKDDARSMKIPCRSIPFAMEKPLDGELHRLEESGIIERVESSVWTSLIVTVKKPNAKIKICADFSKGVNAALFDNRHPQIKW